jgi:hypothetical protein
VEICKLIKVSRQRDNGPTGSCSCVDEEPASKREREWGCVTLKLRNNGMMALLPVIIIKCALRYSQSLRVLLVETLKVEAMVSAVDFHPTAMRDAFFSSLSFEFQQVSACTSFKVNEKIIKRHMLSIHCLLNKLHVNGNFFALFLDQIMELIFVTQKLVHKFSDISALLVLKQQNK